MSGGIPIRLVRIDGTLIELMATDFASDVDRGVSGQALWFTGSSRFAFDTNTNAATIIINGIITDDDKVPNTTTQTKAKATIDFSRSMESSDSDGFEDYDTAYLYTRQKVDGILISTAATAAADSVHAIRLTDAAGINHDIYAIQGSSPAGAYSSGRGSFVIFHASTGPYTNTQVATAFKQAVEALPGTPFAAALKTSTLSGVANTVVEITQTTAGSDGNTYSPYIGTEINHSAGVHDMVPTHTNFTGGGTTEGVIGGGKSAGDKVMDLYSIANNSNDPGIGSLSAFPLAAAQVLFGGQGLASGQDSEGMDGWDITSGDYIIGIQIPFDSMINASASQQYKSVNFFMPTGNFFFPHNKMSDSALDASTTFDEKAIGRNYTGIKGTIQKITFTKFAGEPVYGFNLIFAPIDWIV